MRNLTLGEFIKILQLRDPNQQVMYDFGSLRPGEFDSYRGFYEDLALSFDDTWDVSVASLLKKSLLSVDHVFTGYKGGNYKASYSTKLWASNRGLTGSTMIIGIHECDYMTVIKTQWVNL